MREPEPMPSRAGGCAALVAAHAVAHGPLGEGLDTGLANHVGAVYLHD